MGSGGCPWRLVPDAPSCAKGVGRAGLGMAHIQAAWENSSLLGEGSSRTPGTDPSQAQAACHGRYVPPIYTQMCPPGALQVGPAGFGFRGAQDPALMKPAPAHTGITSHLRGHKPGSQDTLLLSSAPDLSLPHAGPQLPRSPASLPFWGWKRPSYNSNSKAGSCYSHVGIKWKNI